jgi:hypothetical protein
MRLNSMAATDTQYLFGRRARGLLLVKNHYALGLLALCRG